MNRDDIINQQIATEKLLGRTQEEIDLLSPWFATDLAIKSAKEIKALQERISILEHNNIESKARISFLEKQIEQLKEQISKK